MSMLNDRRLSPPRWMLAIDTLIPRGYMGQVSSTTSPTKCGIRSMVTNNIIIEPAVGAAIKKSGVPRGEIFITTKIWNNSHHPDDVEPALDASLKDLGTDYVDLYLMHWPCAWRRGQEPRPKDENGKMILGETDYVDTYKAMERLYRSGKAKAIGVSNFSRAEMERLLNNTGVVSQCQISASCFASICRGAGWMKSKRQLTVRPF